MVAHDMISPKNPFYGRFHYDIHNQKLVKLRTLVRRRRFRFSNECWMFYSVFNLLNKEKWNRTHSNAYLCVSLHTYSTIYLIFNLKSGYCRFDRRRRKKDSKQKDHCLSISVGYVIDVNETPLTAQYYEIPVSDLTAFGNGTR